MVAPLFQRLGSPSNRNARPEKPQALYRFAAAQTRRLHSKSAPTTGAAGAPQMGSQPLLCWARVGAV